VAPKGVERRLAAILFTDMVGSTAVTARSEADGMRLRDRHRERVRTYVERYGGTLVEAPGDESLSVFESALDAAHCALALGEAVEAEPDLRITTGIHLGETVYREQEVFGDGVNIAARVRSLAEPGEILVSGEVAHAIRNHPHLETEPRGEHKLKNVGRPISVFALSGTAPDGVASPPASAGAVGRNGYRWLRRVAFGSAGLLLGVVVLLVAAPELRVRVVATGMLAIQRLLPVAVDQEIGSTLSADGVRIAYATLGSGPALVLSLPEGVSHLERGAFSPTNSGSALARLGERHLVVRYDPRGFGLSERGVEHSHEGSVNDLEAVVEAERLDRFDLWGYSFGGGTAISYAARHPERVRRLVLYGANAHPAAVFSREWHEAMAKLLRESWGRDDGHLRDFASHLFVPDASEVELRLMSASQEFLGTGEDFANAWESRLEVDVSAEAARIRCPTLIVHRRGDLMVPFEHGLELRALIPGSRLVALGGSNHIFLPSDRADRKKMFEAIEEFLEAPDESLGSIGFPEEEE
jgi:class 3 adenylate cyclase/pimeloyl-ACP methyl ester carboxylesterase